MIDSGINRILLPARIRLYGDVSVTGKPCVDVAFSVEINIVVGAAVTASDRSRTQDPG